MTSVRAGGPNLPSSRRRPVAALLTALALAFGALTAACGGPVLANRPLEFSPPPTLAPRPTLAPDPVPIVLPRDDAPHDRLTEWWYYTGHLRAADGRRFGFEAVVFRAERGDVPVTWASHVALTDEANGRFLYAQRTELGPQVDQWRGGGHPVGYALAITGADPRDPSTAANTPWTLTRGGPTETISVALSPSEARLAGGSFELNVSAWNAAGAFAGPPAAERGVVRHDGDGWIDFGPAGGSYYYSRPRIAVSGTVTVDGSKLDVTGSAWFDHQWGDFISVGGGGWDWFAVNLDDGTDITLSLVRAADGSYPLVYGTLAKRASREAPGIESAAHLDAKAFTVDVVAHWTSPRTGVSYPAGWVIRIPGEELQIELRPTVPGQELDTRATTGVVYWEGSQRVSATRGGRPVGGEAYVELTGYASTTH